MSGDEQIKPVDNFLAYFLFCFEGVEDGSLFLSLLPMGFLSFAFGNFLV